MTINPEPFYDRKLELAALDRAWWRHRTGGQMLLLYGHRRLGKTFLLQHFFAAVVDGNEPEKLYCYFLAEWSTAATQRLALARQLVEALPSEGVSAEDIVLKSVKTAGRNLWRGRRLPSQPENPREHDTWELPDWVLKWKTALSGIGSSTPQSPMERLAS